MKQVSPCYALQLIEEMVRTEKQAAKSLRVLLKEVDQKKNVFSETIQNAMSAMEYYTDLRKKNFHQRELDEFNLALKLTVDQRNAQVKNLEKELGLMRSEVQQMKALLEKYADAARRLPKVEGQLQAAQEQLLAQKASYDALSRKTQDTEVTLEKTKQANLEAAKLQQNEQKQFRALLEAKERDASALQKELLQSSALLKQQMADLAEAKKRSEAAESALSEAKKTQTTLQTQLRGVEADAQKGKEAQEKATALEQLLAQNFAERGMAEAQLRKDLESVAQERNTLKAEAKGKEDAWNRKYEELLRQHAAADMERDILQEKQQKALADAEGRLKVVEESAKAELSRLNAELTKERATRHDLQEMARQNETRVKAATETDAQLAEALKQLKAVDAQRLQAEKERDASLSELQRLFRQAAEQEKSFADLKQQASQTQEEGLRLRAAVQELEKQARNADAKAQGLQAQQRQMESDAKTHMSLIKERSDQLEALKMELGEKSSALTAQEKQIAQLVKELQTKTALLDGANFDFEQKTAALKMRCEAASNLVVSLTKQVEAQAQERTKLAKAAEQTQQQLVKLMTTHQQQLQQRDNKYNELEKLYKQLKDSDVTKFENQIAQLAGLRQQHETMIREQAERIQELLAENAKLKKSLRDIQAQSVEAAEKYEQGMQMQREVEFRIEMLKKCHTQELQEQKSLALSANEKYGMLISRLKDDNDRSNELDEKNKTIVDLKTQLQELRRGLRTASPLRLSGFVDESLGISGPSPSPKRNPIDLLVEKEERARMAKSQGVQRFKEQYFDSGRKSGSALKPRE